MSNLPESCTVGEELGLCAVCGPLLTPVMPANDPNCPPIDCSSLTQYQAMNVENDGRVCMQYRHDPQRVLVKVWAHVLSLLKKLVC